MPTRLQFHRETEGRLVLKRSGVLASVACWFLITLCVPVGVSMIYQEALHWRARFSAAVFMACAMSAFLAWSEKRRWTEQKRLAALAAEREQVLSVAKGTTN